LGIYTGSSVSSLVTVTNNDDANGSTSTSLVVFPVSAGTEYEIAVDGYGGAFGSIALGITLVIPSSAPMIASTKIGTQLVLSWGTNWNGYVLESAKTFGVGVSWDQVSPGPVPVGGMYVVTNSMTRSALFYRLHRP
jgi:hypothetical protein